MEGQFHALEHGRIAQEQPLLFLLYPTCDSVRSIYRSTLWESRRKSEVQLEWLCDLVTAPRKLQSKQEHGASYPSHDALLAGLEILQFERMFLPRLRVYRIVQSLVQRNESGHKHISKRVNYQAANVGIHPYLRFSWGLS